jgi:hypothetical protein
MHGIKRRLMRLTTFVFLILTSPCIVLAQSAKTKAPPVGAVQRAYLVNSLVKIADPVLVALSNNELKKTMPVECVDGALEGRKQVTYLEAFGRLLSGMAPWLELGGNETTEGKLRQKYTQCHRSKGGRLYEF